MLSLLLLAIVPLPDCVLRDRCDLTEQNFFYDENGKLVFEQIVWFDFERGTGTERIVDWRMAKEPSMEPYYDHSSREWVTRFFDNNVLREVRSKFGRTVWLQYDSEVTAREDYPVHLRRKLRVK